MYAVRFNFLLWLLFLYSANSFGQTHVFAQLRGTPVNTTGWNLYGAAKIGNITATGNGEVILCPAQTAQSGAIFYNQPINLSLCNKWISEFDFRIFDGTGADGIAFCFLDSPPSGLVSGGGLGIPGTANGLKICFDPNPNCTAAVVPKIEIRYGTGYDECWAQPTVDNNAGTLNFIRSNAYNHAKLTYDNGIISVYVNNTLYLTGNQQFNFPGYLGFTAATGARTDNHSIKNVSIYIDIPPSEAGNDLALCPGATQQIGTSPDAGLAYSWTPSLSLSAANIANPIITNTNNTNADITRKYFVQTSFFDGLGCSSTDSVIVTIKKPLLSTRISGKICNSGSYTLPSGKIVSNPGLYNDTVRGSFSCDSLVAIVDLSRQNVVINNSAVTLCPGQQFTLPWGTVISSAGSYYDTIKYSSGCDSLIRRYDVTQKTLILKNSPAFICPGQSFRLPWGPVVSATGVYSDTVKYITGCDSLITSVSLTVTNVTRISTKRSICAGRAYTLPSGTIINTAGIYVDTLRSVIAGCDSIITILTLDTNLKPTVSLNKSNDVSCITATAKLNASGGSNYLWSPANSLNDPRIANPVASPGVTTVYHVTVSSLDGCVAEDSIKVEVIIDPSSNKFNLPNAFTPNNDGANDCFGISNWGAVSDLDFAVYNRWGSQVFHTKDPTACWDGIAKGFMQPSGAYIYNITAKTICGFIRKKGMVMLIR